MGTRLRGRRIAIAILDPALRTSLRASLERESAEVLELRSIAGLLRNPEGTAELAILDIDLPDLAQASVVAELPALTAGIPVVLLSGHLAPALSPGPLRDLPTLTLPFGRARLIELITRLLAPRS
jgi:DNA-binding NtrC family response regulator